MVVFLFATSRNSDFSVMALSFGMRSREVQQVELTTLGLPNYGKIDRDEIEEEMIDNDVSR